MKTVARPQRHWMIVKELDTEINGIALPPGAHMPRRGIVIAAGPEVQEIEVGSVVLWPPNDPEYGFPNEIPVRLNDESLLIVSAMSVVCVLEDVEVPIAR